MFSPPILIDGKLANIRSPDWRNPAAVYPCYYYSAFDHEISPVWTRDGRENHFCIEYQGHIYGTGGFWADVDGHPSRANFTMRRPIGRRVPTPRPTARGWWYGSYLGRSWHNLWVLPTKGGDAF